MGGKTAKNSQKTANEPRPTTNTNQNQSRASLGKQTHKYTPTKHTYTGTHIHSHTHTWQAHTVCEAENFWSKAGMKCLFLRLTSTTSKNYFCLLPSVVCETKLVKCIIVLTFLLLFLLLLLLQAHEQANGNQISWAKGTRNISQGKQKRMLDTETETRTRTTSGMDSNVELLDNGSSNYNNYTPNNNNNNNWSTYAPVLLYNAMNSLMSASNQTSIPDFSHNLSRMWVQPSDAYISKGCPTA